MDQPCEVCWKHWSCSVPTWWCSQPVLVITGKGRNQTCCTLCRMINLKGWLKELLTQYKCVVFRWITFHNNSSVVYEWSLGRPNAMIFLSVQFFFRLWRHSERYREQPYDRRWNHDRVILVFDITRTTACIRIFDQMDTSDSIRFMSKASYTASGSTEFKDFIIHFFSLEFRENFVKQIVACL